jgi:hypothetical protein
MNPRSVVGALQTAMANLPPDQREPLADAISCIVELAQRVEGLEWMLADVRAAMEAKREQA